ncbi:MAG: serine/threonine protein phosphatase [Caulobacterales bacterium 32-69-10]|nr:MAG: serine/threonine protein phosphatase [Caulobacterales bacterium 32-69-10]
MKSRLLAAALAALALLGPGRQPLAAEAETGRFTIAVLPDTQYYADYQRQRAEGFPFDAAELLDQQTRFIAENARSRGGDIVFTTSVGDLWQHATVPMDPGHAVRGLSAAPNPFLQKNFAPTSKVQSVEIPIVVKAFRSIDGLMPFAVVPGNHDYDAMWTDSRYPPLEKVDPAVQRTLGVQHVGGLTNFVAASAFGSDSAFFAGKPWYVASNDAGADSAQIFSAGGYRFLHIGLQFNPPESSLRWAQTVMRQYPGTPTILTTHDYLSPKGERLSDPAMDARLVDPVDTSPQMVWDQLISLNDQIFLVLCGHQYGQARREDRNAFGHQVDQILSDYQERGQSAADAGAGDGRPVGIGDGWLRLMTFDMTGAVPTIHVRTYSTFYGKDSKALPTYAQWYKPREKPELSDEDFLAQDDFVIRLADFRSRFDKSRR